MQIIYHGSYCKVEIPKIKVCWNKGDEIILWENLKNKTIYFLYVA